MTSPTPDAPRNVFHRQSLVWRFPLWARVGAAIVVIVGGFLSVVAWVNAKAANVETRTHADSTYVSIQSYNFIRQRDSLVQDARDARMDAMVGALYRACQRRGECP